MWDQVDVSMDAEGHLLERSTSDQVRAVARFVVLGASAGCDGDGRV